MDPSLFPLKTPRPPVVVHVRKRPAFEAAPSILPGAVWRDPRAVEQWAAVLPSGCSVVVYWVHGHEVSRGVRDALHRGGVMAGITGWPRIKSHLYPRSRARDTGGTTELSQGSALRAVAHSEGAVTANRNGYCGTGESHAENCPPDLCSSRDRPREPSARRRG